MCGISWPEMVARTINRLTDDSMMSPDASTAVKCFRRQSTGTPALEGVALNLFIPGLYCFCWPPLWSEISNQERRKQPLLCMESLKPQMVSSKHEKIRGINQNIEEFVHFKKEFCMQIFLMIHKHMFNVQFFICIYIVMCFDDFFSIQFQFLRIMILFILVWSSSLKKNH